MWVCKVCNQEVSKNYFSQHLRRFHQESPFSYTIKYIRNGIQPYCKCGCGKLTCYVKKEYRFNDYIHNHHNYDGKSTLGKKVHTLQSLENAKLVRKKTVFEKYGVENVMQIKEFSEKVKLIQEKHGMWKGGTSSLVHRLRASHKLYGEWKYPILKRDNFSCQDCGLADSKLNVHHNKETMSEIMQKFVSKFDKPKTFDESSVIIDAIVEYHVKNNVSGVSLCKACHSKRHSESKDSD